MMFRALRSQGYNNRLTLINLNRIQHMAGVQFFIFEFPRRRLPHLEGSWLIHLCQTLSRLDASLQATDVLIFPSQREHDSFLMDLAISCTILSDKEIRYINYCRLYLQALQLSDICSASGTQLSIGVLGGIILPCQVVSRLNEPYQERPGPAAWQAWRKFLRTFTDPSGKLNRPLGNWLHESSDLYRGWPFLFSPSLNLLFKWRLDTYIVLRRVHFRIHAFGFKLKTLDLPDDCIPVDWSPTSDGWRISSFHLISLFPGSPSTISSFDEYIDTLLECDRCQLLSSTTNVCVVCES
jgi:hypothetical protein